MVSCSDSAAAEEEVEGSWTVAVGATVGTKPLEVCCVQLCVHEVQLYFEFHGTRDATKLTCLAKSTIAIEGS